MVDATGLFVVGALEAEQLVEKCGREGGRIFVLPESIRTRDDFFAGIRQVLPLDPPLESSRSWEALADSLWSGLDSLPDSKVVVVWPSASLMENQSPEDFRIATDILSELPDSLADVEVTAGQTKQVLVLQVV
jgi:hypothetical protein